MSELDKRALLAEVLRAVEASRATAAAAAEISRKGATHPEMRAEDPKDMRSTELSYLARGQALRVDELDDQLQVLRFFDPPRFQREQPIGAGALVSLEGDDGDKTVFVLPRVGGIELPARDGIGPITVISTTSPLGTALLGRAEGDDLEFRVGGTLREYVVTRVV